MRRMMRSVYSSSFGPRTRPLSGRRNGLPIVTVTSVRRRRGMFSLTFSVPVNPTGTMGTSARVAM